jgi:hypothetical protein
MNKKAILFIFSAFILIIFSTVNVWAQKESVYKGPIYNIFFHPLIVYPELAFNRTNASLNYMDEWFVTVNEFKKILPELYKRGFILFSPKDLFEEKKNAQSRLIITRKKLILPEGKKPLILSLDDYNFYKTMKLHGTVHLFWIDKQDRLVTITNKNKAAEIIRDDQEIPQLLEKFIIEHPDFSYNNARGIIDLTGYNGIFGYNTHELHSSNYQSQLFEAKRVVKKLKEMGWEFGSHSYFHLGEKKQTEQAFQESEKRWLKEVGMIVGPTFYYIFPFGESWDEHVIRLNFLKSLGYKYFFGVSQANRIILKAGAVIMERVPIDGAALRGKYTKAKVFINPADILDSSRLVKIK